MLSSHIWGAQYHRIVSISPVITEILYDLNAQDKLVGVTTACHYPKAADILPKIGNFTSPNLEKIVLLKPDLVLGMGNAQSPGNLKLQSLGIKTMVLESPQTIEDILQLIQLVGDLSNSSLVAKQKIVQLRQALATIKTQTMTVKPKVMVIIWAPPITIASNQTFIGNMVEMAGGKIVYQPSPMPFPVPTAEFILTQDPDIIMIGDPSCKASVMQDKTIQLTRAARKQHIYTVLNPDILLRPGPRFIEGIRMMRDLIRKGG